jgi:DNA topoisomerase I
VLNNEKTSNVLSWLSSIDNHDSTFDDFSKNVKKTSNQKAIHMEQTKGITFSIVDIEERKTSRNPPSPFITSSLQQECSNKLGLSPSRTMSLAQNLYEDGLITYMRTDSPVLSNLGRKAAEEIVSSSFGKEYLFQAHERSDTSSRPSKKSVIPKNAQEAHEAIRPADAGGGKFKLPEDTGLDGVHLKLYELIYRRTLASVMVPSQTLTKTYSIVGRNDIDSESSLYKEVKFRFSESSILFNGYLAVYGSLSTKKTEEYPTLSKGQHVWLSKKLFVKEKADIREDDVDGDSEDTIADDFAPFLSYGLRGQAHVTKPPSRFTEAGFIQELEAAGVGRPSTYAKTFETLREREYVIVDGKTIIPTLKGATKTILIQFLRVLIDL